MSQFTVLPPAPAQANPAIGINGATAPTSSIEVGGIGPDGNLHPISTDNSGVQNVNVSSSTLPTGSATATNQVLEIAQLTGIHSDTTSIDGKTPALGQALAAASVPVVLPAAQITALTPPTTVTVQQATGTNLHAVIDNFPATQPISGHVITDTGSTTAVSALPALVAGSAIIGKVGIDQTTPGTTNGVQVNAALPAGANIIGKISIDQTTPGTTNGVQVNAALPAGANVIGHVIVDSGSIAATQSGTWTVQPGNTPNTTAWLVTQGPSTTSAVTSVAGSASSVSLLASNASRKGATFYNDSTAILYLKLGATASTSSYTVQLVAGAYYELPFVKTYTGAIDGIWASANGNVRITELS